MASVRLHPNRPVLWPTRRVLLCASIHVPAIGYDGILWHQDPFSMNPFLFGMICESIANLCYRFDIKLSLQTFGPENRLFPEKRKQTVVYVYKYIILMIDAKCLAADWQSKSHNAITIHAKLVVRFGGKGPADSSVTKWLRSLHFRGVDRYRRSMIRVNRPPLSRWSTCCLARRRPLLRSNGASLVAGRASGHPASD
jgi:hypothetical protein